MATKKKSKKLTVKKSDVKPAKKGGNSGGPHGQPSRPRTPADYGCNPC